jgi:hypothetical protein
MRERNQAIGLKIYQRDGLPPALIVLFNHIIARRKQSALFDRAASAEEMQEAERVAGLRGVTFDRAFRRSALLTELFITAHGRGWPGDQIQHSPLVAGQAPATQTGAAQTGTLQAVRPGAAEPAIGKPG